MQLTHNGKHFVLKCAFQDRDNAKQNGFSWDSERKFWYTESLTVAARMRLVADSEAKKVLANHLIKIEPCTLPLLLPPKENGELLPHQLDAVRFALERDRCYIGADAGLGKTADGAVTAATLGLKTVFITPPFLVQNVINEFARWAPHLKLTIFGSKEFSVCSDVMILPDSLLNREEVYRTTSSFIGGLRKDALLIVDEAHRFKSLDAKRTQALFGGKMKRALRSLFCRELYMSGTPMPNRPMELFPVLSKVAPETIDFKNMFQYGLKFCSGFKTKYGWDFSGASNVEELAKRVIYPSGPFMLRQKKELLNLPPIIEEIFVLSKDESPRLVEMGKKIGSNYKDVEDLLKHQLRQKAGVEGEFHLATYRRLLGMEKIEPGGEYISAILDEYQNEKVLAFVFHKEVAAGLFDKLSAYKPYLITGDTPKAERQKMVENFQKDKLPRLMIGNYQAMGVGFTLTAATRVVFIEFDWTPGVNRQAADRSHRIGQTKSVLVQYIVFKDSLDQLVIETLLRKQKSIQHV